MAERIEGLTIAIFYLYAPLFYSLLFPVVPLLCRFTASETAWTWLSFSLHENAQKIKPANGFFTEMTYLERSVHLRHFFYQPNHPEWPPLRSGHIQRKNYFISRLSRSAERSKRIFTKKVGTETCIFQPCCADCSRRVTAAADAFYPDGPSCENAIQKSPQAFLTCKYKNFLPYFIAKANAAAIFNR